MFIGYIIILLITLMIGEYIAHKYLMHAKLFRLEKRYQEHHIEHHSKNRMDINIDLWPFAQLILFSPIIAGIWYYNWIWGATFIGMLLGHSLLWSMLHRSYHNLGFRWIKYVFPFYNTWRQHHLNHHLSPNKNYGAVFGPIPDILIGSQFIKSQWPIKRHK